MPATTRTKRRFEYHGFHGCRCTCMLEIIDLDDGRHAIIVTEIQDNPGTSVTNAAEMLVVAICREFLIPPQRMVWIEHYPPDDPHHGIRKGKSSWDLVTFKMRRDGGGAIVESPQWRPMQPDDWHELGLEPRSEKE